jgi:2'-5' RNA ligase
VRIFIAVDLSNELRDKLGQLIEQFRTTLGEEGVRWVDPRGIHLTLKFIGETPAERFSFLEDAVDQALNNFVPFDLKVGGTECFPNFKKPRVLGIGVKDPTMLLNRLQRSIENEASRAGFPRDNRKFHPHLTLGRVRRRSGSDELERISAAMVENRQVELGKEHVTQISIIRSDLSSRGPKYTALSTKNLGKIR